MNMAWLLGAPPSPPPPRRFWRIWPPPPPPPPPPPARLEFEVTLLLLALPTLLVLLFLLRRRRGLHHIKQPGHDRPHEQRAYAKMPSDTAARIAGNFELAALKRAEPDLAHKVESIVNDAEWLQCFWAACGHDVEATTARVRCCASWGQDYELDEPKAAEILSAGLIDILPGGDDDGAVVAVVRDIQIIGRLLQTRSFQEVIAAHLMQLQRLLKTSARAREYGVSMVHDLSRLNLSLVGRMIDPRNLHAQLQATRYLFTAFPVRFETIVVVDAPSSFGMILNAVKAVAPGAIPKPLQFVYRPHAESHCKRVFGQPVL